MVDIYLGGGLVGWNIPCIFWVVLLGGTLLEVEVLEVA